MGLSWADEQKKSDEVMDFLDTYRAGAEAGKAEYQYDLGASYRWGIGAERNITLAVQWIRKAAEQSYPLAERVLADMYRNGEGLTASDEQALWWYMRAARHGDPEARKAVAILKDKVHLAKPPDPHLGHPGREGQ